MKKTLIFNKMKDECMTAVHTAALAYGLRNIEVALLSRRITVMVYAGKGYEAFTLFSTGRLVHQYAENIREMPPVTEESVLKDMVSGKGDAGRMLVDLVGDLFSDAERMQNRYIAERKAARKQRRAAESEDYNDEQG